MLDRRSQVAPSGPGSRGAEIPGADRLTIRLAALLACGVAVLICLPSLWGGFVIDDRYLILENPALRSLAQIPGHFTNAWGGGFGGAGHAAVNAGYFRPVTSTLYSIEYAAFGPHPLGWHGVSVALHALSTGCLVFLAARLLPRPALALVAGLIFAVHPVHTEAIAAISYQTTLLATLLALIGLFALDRAAQAGTRRTAPWLLLAAGATLLAGLAKEEAFATPLIAAAWLFFRHPTAPRSRTIATFVAPALGTLLAAFLRARVVTGSQITFFGDAGPAVIAPTMLGVLVLYARLLVAPIRLCPFYDWFIIPPSPSLSLDVLIGAALLLGLPALAWWLRRRSPAAALGLAWMALGLLPVLHLVPMLNVAAERFLYLPSGGFAIAIAAAVGHARTKSPRIVLVAGALILIGFAARTLYRWPDWRDDRSLNTATAAAFPETPTPLLNLAGIASVEGDLPAAAGYLREAEARAPGFPGTKATAARIFRGKNPASSGAAQ